MQTCSRGASLFACRTQQRGKNIYLCRNENKRFIALINGKTSEKTYSLLNNTETWHAISDASGPCSNTASLAGINLGLKKFKNKIPSGFKPFIDGDEVYKLRCKQIVSCAVCRKHTFISFLTMIISVSQIFKSKSRISRFLIYLINKFLNNIECVS